MTVVLFQSITSAAPPTTAPPLPSSGLSTSAGPVPHDDVAPRAGEIYVTQKALRALADVIRYGGKGLQVIRSHLDDKASAAFTK